MSPARVPDQHYGGLDGHFLLAASERARLRVVLQHLDHGCVGKFERRDLVVLDVRPVAEYTGHIAGARSVPITELRRKLKARSKDGEIVAYCRGRYCVYVVDAVRQLNRRGFRARRLMDGFPEWKRAGLSVAAGEG